MNAVVKYDRKVAKLAELTGLIRKYNALADEDSVWYWISADVWMNLMERLMKLMK